MTSIRTLDQSDPGDLRFQFEIIRELSSSVRATANVLEKVRDEMAEDRKVQVQILERLAKIEANTVNEQVEKLADAVADLADKVDKLEKVEDQRVGVIEARRAVVLYWPVILTFLGVIFTVVFLLMRATGIMHVPEEIINAN